MSEAHEPGVGWAYPPAVAPAVADATALVLELVQVLVVGDEGHAVERHVLILLVLAELPGISSENVTEMPLFGSVATRLGRKRTEQAGLSPLGGVKKVCLGKRKRMRHAGGRGWSATPRGWRQTPGRLTMAREEGVERCNYNLIKTPNLNPYSGAANTHNVSEKNQEVLEAISDEEGLHIGNVDGVDSVISLVQR